MSVGALNMHSMQVKCEVEADPADSVKFHWTYNNTRNVSPVSIVICDVKSHGELKFTRAKPACERNKKIKFYCVMDVRNNGKLF